MSFPLPLKKRLLSMLFLLGTVMLSACSSTPGATNADGINDPYEKQNRKVHEFNRKIDKAVLRPTSRGFSTAIPDEIEQVIGNFSENLSQPSVIVNSLLQGDIENASFSTIRFLTNTILGFGGVLDAATAFQVPDHHTDFGETLHRWGVKEGPYVELPLIGPSTVRDATGRVVDLFTNPLTYKLKNPEKYYGRAAGLASGLSNRSKYSETIDSILYESADSYAQSRLIYLQNRRFKLNDSVFHDATDPYSDPYEDPYAQ